MFVEGPKAPQLLYMNPVKELDEIVNAVLDLHPGIFLVEAKHNSQLHEYTIDGDKPLGIYDVADVSREVNRLADEKMPEEKYSLEIGSPGADSPLLHLRQYPKHIGREFSVTTSEDVTFKGKLTGTDGNSLTFESYKSAKPKKNELPETITLDFSNIKTAHIILSFK